jgi:hypothetical protein
MWTGESFFQTSLVERPLLESRQERSLWDFLEKPAKSSAEPVHAAGIPRGACFATMDGSLPSPNPQGKSRSARRRAKAKAKAKTIASSHGGVRQGVGENSCASTALTQPAATRPQMDALRHACEKSISQTLDAFEQSPSQVVSHSRNQLWANKLESRQVRVCEEDDLERTLVCLYPRDRAAVLASRRQAVDRHQTPPVPPPA